MHRFLGEAFIGFTVEALQVSDLVGPKAQESWFKGRAIKSSSKLRI